MRDWLTPQWPVAATSPCNTRILVTTRGAEHGDEGFGAFNLGDHVGDRVESVAQHRAAVNAHLGVAHTQWLAQVHGTGVIAADAASAQRSLRAPPQADAAYTTETGVALAIMTADCVPVVLTDPEDGWIAGLHGGWRGLVDGIVETLIGQLQGVAVRSPEHWQAWIGPAICGAHYEVGADVASAVRAAVAVDSLTEVGLRDGVRADKYQLDLAQLAHWQLSRCGVRSVVGSGLCSFGDQRFYSHRRSMAGGFAATGRMATLIWIR